MVYEDRPGEGREIRVDPFVSEFDMGLARPLSRSVRLNGFATCLRLEQVYWDILGRYGQGQLLFGQCAVVPCGPRSAFASRRGQELHRAGAGCLRRAQLEGRGLRCDTLVAERRNGLSVSLCSLTAAQAAFNGYNPALCRKTQRAR